MNEKPNGAETTPYSKWKDPVFMAKYRKKYRKNAKSGKKQSAATIAKRVATMAKNKKLRLVHVDEKGGPNVSDAAYYLKEAITDINARLGDGRIKHEAKWVLMVKLALITLEEG